MRLNLAIFGAVLLGSACAPKPPLSVVSLHPIPQELADAGNGIRIVDGPDVARVIKVISATDCQKLPTDPPADKPYALALLKQEAATLSVNGIAKLTYSEEPVEGCLAAVKAGGLAVMAF